MAYTVFESTNMASTKYAARIFDVISTTDVENGTFGYIEELATNENTTYVFHAGTKAGATVVVADQPAWTEDTTKITNQRKDKFIIEAGTRFRVREVKKNDVFAISLDGFSKESDEKYTSEKKFVTISTNGKLACNTATTSGAIMEGKIEYTRESGNVLSTQSGNYGNKTSMYVIRVTTLA